MSQKFEKLKTVLKELFQLDQPDLDFGLYRIMHAKSAEVTQFLDKDLLPQVRQAFGLYRTADKAELEKELAKAIQQAQSLGADPETLPKVKELRASIANEAVDIGALESEVYDHLLSFFRRYYSEGDFLAKRVYRAGVYAVPYEGEEVKLHWANRDQYYIKTSEYLRDYAFRLRPDDVSPMRVHFRLIDAEEGEHGNVKASEGKDRVFILASENFIAEEDGELVLRFAYRPANLNDWPDSEREGKKKAPTQKDLRASAVSRILAITDNAFAQWIFELAKPHVTVSGETQGYSRLEGHLRRYTERNTFDYFIHKDLGAFLRRELDFYIKNEVIQLDDIENETAPRVEQYLSKLKVIRQIAGKIIDFLAQLEDFQKRLWLKKKFVIDAQYVVTLDLIPEEYYPEIISNDAQRKEWVRLFSIDQIQNDLAGGVAYSNPLTIDFLKAYPSLPVDTGLFDSSFKERLISTLGNLDDTVTGTLIHGENSQALALIERRFRGKVNFVYIDPPYNTGTDEFVYKDNYQRSSWLSLMSDRVELALRLLSPDGVFTCSLDDNETFRFGTLAEEWRPRLGRLGEFVWRTRNTDNRVSSRLSVDHDYIHVFAPAGGSIQGRVIDRSNFKNLDNDPRGVYTTDPLTGKANAVDRPNLHYVITNEETGDVYPPDPDFGWITDKAGFDSLLQDKRIYWPKNPKSGKPRKKRFLYETADRAPVSSLEIEIQQGEGNRDLTAMFGEKLLNFPKPVSVIRTVVDVCCPPDGMVMDFFAGSGTTGEAVIRSNREQDCSLQFILVEVSSYFETLLKPRVLKAIGASAWNAGAPTGRDGSRNAVIRYFRTESYEDTLNNLVVRRTVKQDDLLASSEAQGADGLKEHYMLRYMLDVETRGSQSLLNVQAFADPTAYKLKVKLPGSDESREVNVDLLETFNWLVGLTVKTIAASQSFSAEFERNAERRLVLKGRLRQDPNGPWWIRTVTGTLPDGRRTLIIWRKLTGDPEQDNLVLNTWFARAGYSAKDGEFDIIYINGDNNLENLKAADDTWKVRLIEDDFHRLMFDTGDL